jgi:hypothetical protein
MRYGAFLIKTSKCIAALQQFNRRRHAIRCQEFLPQRINFGKT